MRIRVTFKNNNVTSSLPINTNYYLSETLQQISYEYNSFLYSLIPRRYRNGRAFDFFTFSQLLIPKRKIINRKIVVMSKEFHWYISSPFHQFLGIIAHGLRKRGKIRIRNQVYEIERVAFLKSPKFSEEGMRFKCLSPVIIQLTKNENIQGVRTLGNFILPDDEKFIDKVREDIEYKFRMVKGYSLRKLDFKMRFDERYLQSRDFKITKLVAIERKRHRPDMVRGFLAPFYIKARPEVLQLIYDTGLGDLNKLGFGMVERVDLKRKPIETVGADRFRSVI